MSILSRLDKNIKSIFRILIVSPNVCNENNSKFLCCALVGLRRKIIAYNPFNCHNVFLIIYFKYLSIIDMTVIINYDVVCIQF